jgi:RimJ/RimL family protein N-acetyltransferase
MSRVDSLPREPVDGETVRLREPRESDAPLVIEACSDPKTQRFLPGLPDPYTNDDALWWINEATEAAWAAGGASYAIADPLTDEMVGSIALRLMVEARHQGEVGYWVAPWARGRGIATDATATITNWAFQHGFARIELLTEHENVFSQRVAMAAGYQREGIRRAAGARSEGSRYDLVVFARLWDDPPGPTPRLLPDLPGGELSDGTVTLRPLRTEDIDDMYALHSLPEVVASTVPPVPPDPATTALRCARAASRWLAGERVELTIRDTASGEFTGEIGLFYQEPPTGQAMIGYDLVPKWRGRGYATRAARLVADWAFASTGIGRLIAGTSPANVASQRVLERAGFTREAVLRGRLLAADGTRVDDLLYARLRPTRTPSR